MGILHLGKGVEGVQVMHGEDAEGVEQAKKAVKKSILPIVLLVCIFLGLIVVSIASHEWYVADATGCGQVYEGVYLPTHYGLIAMEYDLGELGRSHSAYEGIYEDHNYHDVARNLLITLIAVILLSFLFMYLVGRMEDGLDKGGSKWSFLIPSIIGTVYCPGFCGNIQPAPV